jgi:hypothetical protein
MLHHLKQLKKKGSIIDSTPNTGICKVQSKGIWYTHTIARQAHSIHMDFKIGVHNKYQYMNAYQALRVHFDRPSESMK